MYTHLTDNELVTVYQVCGCPLILAELLKRFNKIKIEKAQKYFEKSGISYSESMECLTRSFINCIYTFDTKRAVNFKKYVLVKLYSVVLQVAYDNSKNQVS